MVIRIYLIEGVRLKEKFTRCLWQCRNMGCTHLGGNFPRIFALPREPKKKTDCLSRLTFQGLTQWTALTNRHTIPSEQRAGLFTVYCLFHSKSPMCLLSVPEGFLNSGLNSVLRTLYAQTSFISPGDCRADVCWCFKLSGLLLSSVRVASLLC